MSAILWLRARAENVAVVMMAVMFATFLLQIFARYVLPFPVEWTQELCQTLWLWIVLWCAAFCLDDRDHIKFDTLYLATPLRVRRVFALIAAVSVVVAFVVSAPDTWSYLSFYTIQRSSTLQLPLGYVYSVFGLFLVTMVLRYGLRAIALIRGASPDAVPPGHDRLVEGEEVHLQ